MTEGGLNESSRAKLALWSVLVLKFYELGSSPSLIIDLGECLGDARRTCLCLKNAYMKECRKILLF